MALGGVKRVSCQAVSRGLPRLAQSAPINLYQSPSGSIRPSALSIRLKEAGGRWRKEGGELDNGDKGRHGGESWGCQVKSGRKTGRASKATQSMSAPPTATPPEAIPNPEPNPRNRSEPPETPRDTAPRSPLSCVRPSGESSGLAKTGEKGEIGRIFPLFGKIFVFLGKRGKKIPWLLPKPGNSFVGSGGWI